MRLIIRRFGPTRSRVRRALGTVLALAFGWVLVAGSVSLAFNLPGLRLIGGYPEAEGVDLARPLTGFANLSADFINSVLGGTAAAGATPAGAPGRSVSASKTDRTVVDHGFTNDDFASAYRIESTPFTARTDTSGETRQPDETTACAPIGGTSWYRYTATRSEGLAADSFGTHHANTIGVFRGSWPRLTKVACSGRAQINPQVGLAAEEGVTYYFQITSPTGGGPLVFNLDPIGRSAIASVSATERLADRDSIDGFLSGSGRYVAFSSAADLDPDHPNTVRPLTDVNGSCPDTAANRPATDPTLPCPQIFVRDLVDGTTRMASVSSAGAPGTGRSAVPSISADGRRVAFASEATNLVAGDTNGQWDIFVHDFTTATTRRVSLTDAGQQWEGDNTEDEAYKRQFIWCNTDPFISADGNFVAYTSSCSTFADSPTTAGYGRILLRDLRTDSQRLVSRTMEGDPAIGDNHVQGLSADGRYVAYMSDEPKIVAGDRNRYYDIFLYDSETEETERVSVSSSGDEAALGALPRGSFAPMMSADGRFVAFASDSPDLVRDDTNGMWDIFVRDRKSRRTERVTIASDGAEQQIPADDVFVPAGGPQHTFAMSPDGRYVAFTSDASNLTPGDTNGTSDVFFHDRAVRATTRISLSASGEQANGSSKGPCLSDNARLIAYESTATNLVEGDGNGVRDVFVREIY